LSAWWGHVWRCFRSPSEQIAAEPSFLALLWALQEARAINTADWQPLQPV
jgi:hypothetical protein